MSARSSGYRSKFKNHIFPKVFKIAVADLQIVSALRPKADMCSALAHVCFVPIADIGHSIGLPVFCKFFCATNYLHSNLLSPLVVNNFGFLSERLDIDRLGAGHLHLVDFF